MAYKEFGGAGLDNVCKYHGTPHGKPTHEASDIEGIWFSICDTHAPLYASGGYKVREKKFDPCCTIPGDTRIPWVTKASVLDPAGIGSYSKAETANPKDLLGAKKVSISKLPMVAVLHGAHAMMNGASKYGPFNWRSKKVQADIYVDAAMRHLAAWFEGEENAEDSGVHHLGHAIACCAILLDAQETGNLVDNRPGNGRFNEVLTRLNDVIKKRSEI